MLHACHAGDNLSRTRYVRAAGLWARGGRNWAPLGLYQQTACAGGLSPRSIDWRFGSRVRLLAAWLLHEQGGYLIPF